MLDFTNCTKLPNDYAGSERKTKIIFNDEIYMLKFPDPIREKKAKISYANNQYSEYIGCHIAQLHGLKAQETLLGTYVVNDKTKVCVACRDFCNDGLKLYEFSRVVNSVITTDNDYTTNIEDVYSVINEVDIIKDKQAVIDGFWDMFVLDAIIGNKDRHFNNWGLVEDNCGDFSIAPVYDCGSCLFPLRTEEQMKELYYDARELKSVSYTVASAYKFKGKRLLFYEIPNLDIPDLKRAVVRIGSKFDLEKIRKFVDGVPNLSKEYKEVCLGSMEIRYNHFIKDLIKEKEKVRNLEKQHTIMDENKEFKKNIVLGFKSLPKKEKEPEIEEEQDLGREL